MESFDVRLARIEEGNKNILEKVGGIPGLMEKQEKDHEAIVVLKRDRWWMFTLSGAAFTLALTAIAIHFGVPAL